MPYRSGTLLELDEVHAPRPLLSGSSLATEDAQTTFIGEPGDLPTGIAAGEDMVNTLHYDMTYCRCTDGVRVATLGEGRIGYREWATSTGRISPSLEDRYDHDEDMLLA